ncbi:MAG: type II toxin-antitoxin system PemK/MazF family toxin [Cytophagales bacterium]|nr:type II toxin-antitoxin system PemK/MazF family toxin [Cytophagales bacterium]
MSLLFPPRIASIVQCDFTGMIEPEMVKKRDVVVIARNRHNSRLVTVVPLSTTAPSKQEDYHYLLPKNPRPDGDTHKEVWAKCDMVYTLSIARLDLYYTRTRRGGRQSVNMQVTPTDFSAIQKAVLNALNLSDNEPVPARDLESASAQALRQPEQ